MPRSRKKKNSAPRDLTLEAAEKQIRLLIEENRKLAESLEETTTEIHALRRSAQLAIKERDKSAKDSEKALAELEALKGQVGELRITLRTAEAQVRRLSRQVEKNPLNPLTPDEASVLFDKLLGSFRSKPGLELRDVNLVLKVATGKIAQETVLLLPEPGSVDPNTLHELKLTLRSSADLSASQAGVIPR